MVPEGSKSPWCSLLCWLCQGLCMSCWVFNRPSLQGWFLPLPPTPAGKWGRPPRGIMPLSSFFGTRCLDVHGRAEAMSWLCGWRSLLHVWSGETPWDGGSPPGLQRAGAGGLWGSRARSGCACPVFLASSGSVSTPCVALVFTEMQPKFQFPHLEALKSFSRSLDFTLQLKALFATHRSIIAYSCLLLKVMKWFLPPVNLSIIPLSSFFGTAVAQL